MLRLDVLVCACESGLEGTVSEKFAQQRIDAMKTSPGAFTAMSALQAYVEGSGFNVRCSNSSKSAPHRSMDVRSVS